MKLDHVAAFLDVVRAGGFSAAARRRNVPRSTVSLHVRSLERALGVRLLRRSTRSIALTEEGFALFESAGGAMDALERAIDAARGAAGVLRGPIRLTAPADFPTETLARVITTFSDEHPNVHFELRLVNAPLNLVRENIDIAIRVGGSAAMDAVRRTLVHAEWKLFASPRWLNRRGRPTTLEAVTDFISPNATLRRYLENAVLAGRSLPRPSIEADSLLAARELVRSGFGVAMLPSGLCAVDSRVGRVEALLEDSVGGCTPLYLLFPTRADIVPRVRVFADRLVQAFREEQLDAASSD